MNGLVLLSKDGPVATLTLNRPERHNSLIPELLRDLLHVLDELRSSQPGALVLQANGRSFSTGGDVRAFYEHAADRQAYSSDVVGLLNQAIVALVQFPAPIIAAVHGIVTGGSIGLVLACDIVLVAPETTFTAYYASVGFSPDGGWTAMLPAITGPKRAAEALLLDRTISAEQAVEWGIANRIVPANEIRDAAQKIALALTRQKSGSVRRAKSLLWGNAEKLASGLERERQQFLEQIATAEAQDGMAAFLGSKFK